MQSFTVRCTTYTFVSGVSVVSPRSDVDGWAFADVDNYPGATTDPINGAKHMKDVYLKVAPDYTGRYVYDPPILSYSLCTYLAMCTQIHRSGSLGQEDLNDREQ